MNYLIAFVLSLLSFGSLSDSICSEDPKEIVKMIQQMLENDRYDNHKASGRQYYILKNDLILADPCIQFGGKMLQLTEIDTGRVFEVNINHNLPQSRVEVSLFLENDNLEALGTFECRNRSWEIVNIKFIMF